MANLVLGPLLRHVSRTTATIWVEVDAPSTVEVLGHRTTTFSVADHHYALVIVEGLEPGTTTPYEVLLDGERCWPPPVSEFPASVIRTLGGETFRILFGSCRAAAPHEPPWTLELDHDERGRGVDALYAHGLRMLGQPPAEWPDLMLFVGDQVYADDSSPAAREKIARRRGHLVDDPRFPSLDDVADFEEYTWLYHEAWLPEVERWMLSVVPSAMIFDDHDMIDDWNTSISWVHDIRRQPWWQDHVTGGLMSYWVYQHLGNLSPDEIRAEGMLDRFVELGDATDALRAWAEESEKFTPVPGGYRFSFYRDLGPLRLVVIDSRNGRVLEPGGRQMVDDDEWAWVVEHSQVECEHLVLATSVPVVMPGGLHDLERWNELVSEGAWGRWFVGLGERVRRAVDLEDWAAFHDSYTALMTLLRDIATPGEHPSPSPPATVTIISGDVHFSFAAQASFPDEPGRPAAVSRIHQIVNSPIRNVLAARERRTIRFGLSRAGELIGRTLRRAARAKPDPSRWEIETGPYFGNHVCVLELHGREARMVLERAHPDDEGRAVLTIAAELAL
ncbi:MAG: alkaline phosphatase family protein [Acidimicrobiia bacterium]